MADDNSPAPQTPVSETSTATPETTASGVAPSTPSAPAEQTAPAEREVCPYCGYHMDAGQPKPQRCPRCNVDFEKLAAALDELQNHDQAKADEPPAA